jgi:hypothetical protein
MFVLPTQQEKPNQQKPRDAIMANQEKIFKTNTKRRVTTERITKYTSVRIVRKSLANHHLFVHHDNSTTTLIENDLKLLNISRPATTRKVRQPN